MIRQIQLKDTIQKIENCEQCPIMAHPEKYGLHINDYCQGKKMSGICRSGIPPDCPLEDYENNSQVHHAEFPDLQWIWLKSGDTGLSSLTIFEIMTGIDLKPGILSHRHYPLDPSDFGRCYRLLELFPEWRERLHEVAEKEPSWEGLIHNWGALCAMYEEELPAGTAPKLYDAMHLLAPYALKPCRNPENCNYRLKSGKCGYLNSCAFRDGDA